jgi:regulator of protease activity HflC (stomatin/prohibitin superfamily)
MNTLTTTLIIVGAVVLLVLALALRIVQQYERGVLFRLGRVIGCREPGLRVIIPIVDVLRRVSLRIVTMPIQSRASSPATTSVSMFPPSRTSGSSTR